MASISRSRCAQHSCRRHVGYQVWALQQSVSKYPHNRSPKSSWASLLLRDSRITNTVTHAVTAAHNQARCRPSSQPVSSRYAPGWVCTEARASATGSATAWAVACSRFATDPP
jgi:hypothetical protein